MASSSPTASPAPSPPSSLQSVQSLVLALKTLRRQGELVEDVLLRSLTQEVEDYIEARAAERADGSLAFRRNLGVAVDRIVAVERSRLEGAGRGALASLRKARAEESDLEALRAAEDDPTVLQYALESPFRVPGRLPPGADVRFDLLGIP
ncbi:hypothetical protein H632_c4441p0, partial [Helicosporidium sp. ATCC 50920]